MRITNLTEQSAIYTSNVYLVTGNWNTMDDVNTLIDVGRDPAVIARINAASTGVGKKRIAQVVFTHSHYDHASLLPQIRAAYHPHIYAFSSSLDGVDTVLADGDCLQCGDRTFEVIHLPGHSSDSIGLYCRAEGVLFAGDAPLHGRLTDASYEIDYLTALRRLANDNLQRIYFGHGAPLLTGGQACIARTLARVSKMSMS